MTRLKLSSKTIVIPMEKHTTVTVQKIQRNGFEVKVRFIDLSGTIVKSFVCANSEVDGFINVLARQYNYRIVE